MSAAVKPRIPDWLVDCFYAVFSPILLVLTVAWMALAAFGVWPYLAAAVLYAIAAFSGHGGIWAAGLSFVAGYALAWAVWWFLGDRDD